MVFRNAVLVRCSFMSLGLFYIYSKESKLCGKWNALAEMEKMLSKNSRRGWSHSTYWIPTLLLSLHSLKRPPWQTSDIHSNYLVNRNLRLNKSCCAETRIGCRGWFWMYEAHVMIKNFYLDFVKAKRYRMMSEIKLVCHSYNVYAIFNIRPVCL